MVIKINNKPIQVREDDKPDVDKLYLATAGLGTYFALWAMDVLGRTMLGTSPFPFTHIIDWVIACF